MIGSLLGYTYAKTSSPEIRRLLYELSGMAQLDAPISVEGGNARVDLLINDAQEALVVTQF